MALPQTRDELESIGYKYEGESECRSCGVPILWFTTPNKKADGSQKRMCFHIEQGSENADHRILIPHWASCPNAFHHRTGNKKK